MRLKSMNRAFFLATAALLTLSLCSCGAKSGGPSDIDPDAPTEFSQTESGLKYRILRKSDGVKPIGSNQVVVDYTGWLDDGTIFDTSYGRAESTSFRLASVIPGWTEGMQLIGEGGMIELEIPSELGYGENGQPPVIPPNATLHFKVELHRVER
ncbi:FKBP-type peptidyl-prolyl cis-trans isomerase [Rhodopirellula sp.]|nr:FKBP-type peptidyl-prolyl cis-trans isomerase [Rhodopirellula sp.]MDA9777507.1 FKBP-type peptidyl-prolyl cis-trans isomerase [Rubripirellula sp.]